MGYESKIEWTTHTFNPWWGCTKVSDGCRFCYAESWSNRFGHDIWGVGKARRTMSDAYWTEPAKWNRAAQASGERARVFCASMADVFDEEAPADQRERLWKVIRETPMLDWQLLTKRPDRIHEFLPEDWGVSGYENVWLGTSVEDNRVLSRVEQLVSVPSVVRFLSIEPLIGALPNIPLEGVDWVIVGGESGRTPRPMKAEWVEEIKEQCERANVAFFFKQWGGVNKRLAGRELDGRFYNQLPEPRLAIRRTRRSRNAQSAALTNR